MVATVAALMSTPPVPAVPVNVRSPFLVPLGAMVNRSPTFSCSSAAAVSLLGVSFTLASSRAILAVVVAVSLPIMASVISSSALYLAPLAISNSKVTVSPAPMSLPPLAAPSNSFAKSTLPTVPSAPGVEAVVLAVSTVVALSVTTKPLGLMIA